MDRFLSVLFPGCFGTAVMVDHESGDSTGDERAQPSGDSHEDHREGGKDGRHHQGGPLR